MTQPPSPVSADVVAGRLYEHGPMLLAAARAMTLDDDEANDLVQTTFEIALRRLGQLRDPLALRAWLLRIQAREAFRLTRRLRRVVRLRTGHDGIAAPIADPDIDLTVHRALRALPERTRAAIAIHHLVGMSVRETADVLGVSENTIKTQLRLGLRQLREELRDG